jgi:hypothetical protein
MRQLFTGEGVVLAIAFPEHTFACEQAVDKVVIYWERGVKEAR